MRPLRFGLTECDFGRAQPGFTLISPGSGRSSYLLGMRGEIRHEWHLPGPPGTYAQLLTGGNLLVPIRTPEGPSLSAKGGRIVELDWNSCVVWEYTDHFQHHDFNRLANGNTIYLAWEPLPKEVAARIQGGVPGSENADGSTYGDVIREVTLEGKIAWEWCAAEHFPFERYPLRPTLARHEYAHPNACFPLENGNVMVSWRQIDLVAIIDRASGRFVWEMQDRSWGGQHDCRMLSNGNITLFANGTEVVGQVHSRVLEIDPRTKETVWEYKGSPPATFFSSHISGAQRLPNGNTLICEGLHGRVFEVTGSGDIVWEYVSPFYHRNERGITINQLFRALRYAPNAPEIARRVRIAE